MKKWIKKTAILMAFIMPVIGTASSTSTVSAASATCQHISVRQYSDGSTFLPSTNFVDYCPYCGLVFGRGNIPGGNPMPSGGSCPFNKIVYVP